MVFGALHLPRQFRIESQNIASNFDTRRYALYQIDSSCHGAEMDALCGGALLDIAHVALQRLREEVDRARPVGTRQHPGIQHAAQSRTLRRAAGIVGDVSRDGLVFERVAKTPNNSPISSAENR